jgi:alcohol dehydrogenase class IV
MWYFVSPKIVFGEDALEALETLDGKRALIVTDETIVRLGLVDKVTAKLAKKGFEMAVFDQVECDPCTDTVAKGVEFANQFQPDWVVGLGGGSAMDAAKAIWVLYEHPEMTPGEISPVAEFKLRSKARLCTIPTTSGTGSEVTWGIVLTDLKEQRKMGLGHMENVADIAIVDPLLAAGMPPRLTADTGLDVLTHAVEGYTCAWHNDLADGLCLVGARLTFEYLRRAVADGGDMEARERMHNAATCAGLGFSNSLVSIAHAMGHTMGATFHLPHGRLVGLVLPYTIEFCAKEAPERFADLARFVRVSDAPDEEGAFALAESIKQLCRDIGEPVSAAEAGLEREAYMAAIEHMVNDAFNDVSMVSTSRSPSFDELRMLFEYVYDGRNIDF